MGVVRIRSKQETCATTDSYREWLDKGSILTSEYRAIQVDNESYCSVFKIYQFNDRSNAQKCGV